MTDSNDFITESLTEIIEHVHSLGQHYLQIGRLSLADIAQIKAIIDELQYILRSIEPDHQLMNYLQDTIAHLQKILHHNQDPFDHSSAQQKQNTELSLELLKRIKKLSQHSSLSS